jgi:hypothetical protein
MTLMHTLRNSPWLAKLALLWFALTLGAAVASPMVNPQTELVICTGVGMLKVVLNDDGSYRTTTSPSDGMHCPLCAAGGAPVSVVLNTPQPLHPLSPVLQSIPAAHIAALTAAPPPARGPPKTSTL